MSLTLIFELGDEVYGLEVSAVQEILADPQRHFVPQAGGPMASAINFHGQVLPLIDLPLLLGYDQPDRDYRKIVLTPEYHSLVFDVSSVQQIRRLDLTAQRPAPADSGTRAIRGVVNSGEMPVNLLDTEQIILLLHNLYARHEGL